jgi:phosphoserine aminotransferase
MTRVYNFSPGPAMLPEPVLRQVQAELLDWRGTGMSVMEMSHRSEAFRSIATSAEMTLRELMAIPEHHRVLFLQGGATGQFAAVPLNLIGEGGRADYVDTGQWSKKAIQEARRYANVNVAASTAATGYRSIPSQGEWCLDPGAAYLHYTPNETIGGVEFHWVPDVGGTPLIADMSSTILSRPIDVGRFGVIYAGAQKNIGPAGLTVVIVRGDLIARTDSRAPGVLNYKLQADSESLYNTPPAMAWYVAGLVFDWIKAQGGLAALAERNQRKAQILYSAIDGSDYYQNPVDPECRSWMNVPFTLAESTLDTTFLEKAEEAGLVALKGHRSVGGMRASIYNAMPEEGVVALAAFMKDFEERHG